MKRDSIFLTFCISAAAILFADIVLGVVYALSAAAFLGGDNFPVSSFLPLSIVLIALNTLLLISTVFYFVFRRIKDGR